MASKVWNMLSCSFEWLGSHLKPLIPWVNILGSLYIITIILGGVALITVWSVCINKRRDSDQRPATPLDEAAYIAQMKAVLPFSFRFPNAPTRVLDHLYLGSEQDATNVRNLKQLGITHIINCAGAYCSTGPSFYGSGFKYLQFDAEDDLDYDIMQHFAAAFHFIEDARKSGGKALIHCVMGINRSGALAVSYLMVHQNIGPISAAEQIRKNRSNLLSNDHFQVQVIKFGRQRGLLELDAKKVKSVSK